jgi:lipoyl(octanoyl) transferase
MQQIIYHQHLGLIDYRTAWQLQQSLLAQAAERQRAELPPVQQFLTCAHPHVYTLGRNGSRAHLLVDDSQLQALEAEFIPINRGGDITYHGPGQIVGYPIFDLNHFFTDISRYVRCLEEIILRTIAEYGLTGTRISGASGVWLTDGAKGDRKICAIGVHLSRWITMHGFAFNLHTDLSYFNHIIPCGITDKGVTSLQQELGGEPIPYMEVLARLLHHTGEVFQAQIVAASPDLIPSL